MNEASEKDLKAEGARAAGPVTGEDSRALQTDCARESSPAPPAAETTEQDTDALLAEAEKQRDEYLELARRTKADFENFRKRAAVDVQAAQARGKAQVAREVIDAVDNLERALEAAGEGEDLASGVEMVLKGLRETLDRNGIEQIDPKGKKFDPHRHEALSTQPVEGTDSGVVVEVLQKGYTLGDDLIRPARVVVSA